MTNTQFPKQLYRVYTCEDINDAFSYDTDSVLFETQNLGEAHYYAHTIWLGNVSLAYTIIQPYDDSCCGGYGAWADPKPKKTRAKTSQPKVCS